MVDEKKINAIRNGKPMIIIDVIVMIVALCIALFLVFFIVFGEKGKYILVTYNGEENFYSLSENRVIDVGGHLSILIQDGCAQVINSDCKNHDCMHLGGKISYVGQKIVCHPNRIVIKVTASQNIDPGWVST